LLCLLCADAAYSQDVIETRGGKAKSWKQDVIS
jgi:hypothetical protein